MIWVNRPILKNNQNTYFPRFGFKPKTGKAFSKTGFCFCCVPLSFSNLVFKQIPFVWLDTLIQDETARTSRDPFAVSEHAPSSSDPVSERVKSAINPLDLPKKIARKRILSQKCGWAMYFADHTNCSITVLHHFKSLVFVWNDYRKLNGPDYSAFNDRNISFIANFGRCTH